MVGIQMVNLLYEVARTAVTLTVFGLVAVLSFSQIACENMNGERTVFGKIPIEPKTEEAERIVDSLVMPPSSSVLETRITSKDNMGVVTRKYSTEQQCEENDLYFHTTLVPSGWTPRSAETHGLIFPKTESTFSRGEFKVDVSCDNMRDFRGIRKFYLTCSW